MVRYFCVKANENFNTPLWLQCIKDSVRLWFIQNKKRLRRNP